MKKEEIYNEVSGILVDKLCLDEGMVNMEASLTDDLGADSLDAVELVMELEKVFNIAIPDEDGEGLKTVGGVVDYLVTRVGNE